jgi:hypothetical protein
MAKRKKPRYYVAQVGGTSNFNWSIPENNSPSVVNQTATGATDIYGNTYFKQDNTGAPTFTGDVTGDNSNKKSLWDLLANTNKTELNPAIQGLNAGMQAVTGVANMVNEVKNKKYEKDQYLRAITPDYYENMEGYGLNANPVFTQYGGGTHGKYQVGGQQVAIANPRPIDPTDAYYSANATLAFYKDKLNNKLKAKNPQGFQDYFKGLVDLRRAGNQQGAADYVQNTAYNDFLTPDEVKTTLGNEDYDRYINSLQTVNNYNVSQGKQPLWGTEEGQNNINKLNYGRRFASLVVTPSLSHTNKTRGTTYNRNYTYNPQTQQVDIAEEGDLSIRPSNFTIPNQNRMKTGGIPKTYGLQQGGKAMANVEAERGEAFQTNDGQIAQVANDAPTHEQDGVFLPNVHRVLENTSNLRKDRASKILKLTPEDVKHATGAEVRGNMSHAEALVKANDYFEEKRNKITKKMELAAKDRQDLDKYGELSTKLNMEQFAAMPTKAQLFEQLFNNQEMLKAMNNIPTGGQAKNGGETKKMQLAGYAGSKTGKKTPAGNSDAFPSTANYSFQNYLDEITGKGFKYECITNPADFQAALYDYKLQHGELDDIKNMWKEGMHQKGMAEAKRLGFVDDKGLFKPGVLDNPENLKTLGKLYPDGFLGPRTLKLAKGNKPPRIWSDDDLPQEETPEKITPDFDTTITAPNIVQQARSSFNEPLRWYDVASPVNAYMAALEREPGKYNPMEFNQLRYKLQDPTAALQQNQADYNAAVEATQSLAPNNPGAAAANVANLAAGKYAANNQILGQYENQNAQIKNNEITYNTQVRDKNSLADQQAREVFEGKVLTSKAIQQEQKLTALDSLYKTIAENRALNRNGNLIMKFSRAFDQYGDYNGYQPIFQVPPTFGVQTQTGTNTAGTQAGGGLQQIKAGKDYYNRRSGKTYYFDGNKLLQRK